LVPALVPQQDDMNHYRQPNAAGRRQGERDLFFGRLERNNKERTRPERDNARFEPLKEQAIKLQ
jgi:hypothetical protein